MVIVPAAPLPVVFAPIEIAETLPVITLTWRMTLAVSVTSDVDTPSITVAPVSVTTHGTVEIMISD
jgi:hypothetical protein